MSADEDLIDAILKREGPYVDHPADRGGPTNHGITLNTLMEYRDAPVSIDDVKNLTEAEARAIYRERYLEPFAFLQDDALRAAVVDAAVNHGPTAAVRMLQRAFRIADDGLVGPTTIHYADVSVPRVVRARFVAERIKHYGRIITDYPSQAAFAAGWMARAAEFVEALA